MERGLRLSGINTAIIDKDSKFSEVLLGILMRSSSHGLKVALIDTNNTCSKIIQVLENFSLAKEFKQHFKKIHIETFTKTQKGISRGILPLVEFQTITEEMMYRELYKFDIILIDHPTNAFMTHPKTLSLLKEKRDGTEIVISLNEKPGVSNIQLFNQIIEQKISKQQSLVSNKTITLLSNSPYSNLYCYGRLMLEFINKEQVKYIAFDKADLFYGEHLFFTSVKNWKKNHHLYGDFDYVFTGLPRHTGPSLRTESTPADREEVKEALMLLTTALKKQTPVVVDNCDEAIKNDILDENELYNIIKTANKEVLLPTQKLFYGLKPLAGKVISFSNQNEKIGVKKGIDF